MLLAMNDRSFVVTTAYLKTEAIQTAIFGFVFLGDHLTALKVVAILIATIGVSSPRCGRAERKISPT